MKKITFSNFLILFFILLFPLGQIGKLGQIGEIKILLNDLLVGFIVTYYLLKNHFKLKELLSPIFRYLLIFIITCLLSLLINLNQYLPVQILTAFLYLFRFFAYSLLIIVVSKSNLDIKIINKTILSSFIVTAFIGYFQYFFFPDLRPLTVFGWDPHYYRLAAPFFDTSYTGAILALSLIFLIIIYWSKIISLKFLLLFLFLQTAFMLTYSRSAYGMYVIGIVLLCSIKKSLRYLLLFLSFFLITFLLLPKEKSYGTNLGRQETITARIQNWQNSITIFKSHPIFGVGFNAYRYAQIKYRFVNPEKLEINNAASGGDSSLLFVLATTGLIGFISFLLIMLSLLRFALSNLQYPYSLVFLISLISLIFHSIFSNSLFYPFILEWLFIFYGLSLREMNHHLA